MLCERRSQHLEEQLANLKHSYEGWRNLVTWATLPGQHQMTEGDLQVGVEILDLVQREPQCLLKAMEEDTSQRGTAKMATVQQLVKALEDDHVELKGNLHLLQHQAQLVDHRRRRLSNHCLPSQGQKETSATKNPISGERHPG